MKKLSSLIKEYKRLFYGIAAGTITSFLSYYLYKYYKKRTPKNTILELEITEIKFTKVKKNL